MHRGRLRALAGLREAAVARADRLASHVSATRLLPQFKLYAPYETTQSLLQALFETGATGLEPAASGVTGLHVGGLQWH